MLKINDILIKALKDNKLNLTFTQLNFITKYINSTPDDITKIKNIVESLVINNFKISNIPSLVFNIAKVIKDNNKIFQLENHDMSIVLIKFILVTVIESGALPILYEEKLQVDHIIISSLDLLNLNLKKVEKNEPFMFSRHACCW